MNRSAIPRSAREYCLSRPIFFLLRSQSRLRAGGNTNGDDMAIPGKHTEHAPLFPFRWDYLPQLENKSSSVEGSLRKRDGFALNPGYNTYFHSYN
jgi:hypothetical protein